MKYLAIDVGGTAIKYAIMNEHYSILLKGEKPTPMTSLEDFKKVIKEIYESCKPVAGIGMSLPGMINPKTKKMQIPGALRYNLNVDILHELQSVTTMHFTIENDAKCAALCEVELGSLKGTDVGAVCIIGTGVGGAITLKDKVLKGHSGFAGEFSYISTQWNIQQSFHHFWGVTGSVHSFLHKVKEYCNLKEDIDGKQAFALCNEGNIQALRALKEYCDSIAVGLYNIQAYIDPDKIAIGGGISKQPILMEYIQKALDDIYKIVPVPIPQVQITNCQYYNDSNLIGALVNYKQTYGQ